MSPPAAASAIDARPPLTPQQTADGIDTWWTTRDQVREKLRDLKREYRMLYDLTAIDERMRRHREGQPESDFTVVYTLFSFSRNE